MAISPINLGNTFTNLNGQNVLSGLSSGLNAQTIIDAIVKSQSAQIKPIQDSIDINNTQLDSLSKLKTLLSTLQTAAAALSNPYSPDSSSNVFAVNKGSITSNTTQSYTNYLTVSTSSAATPGTYAISNISSIARKTVQETGAFALNSVNDAVVTAAPEAGKFTAGDIVVNGQTITLEEGDSLTTVAQKFNAANTGITASIYLVSTGNYKLVFNSDNTGEASYFDLSNDTANPVSSSYSISGSTAVFDQVSFVIKQEGTDAHFKLNNIDITRSTNTVSDLLTGVTINLLQDTTTEPTSSFTLKIEPDKDAIAQAAADLANAYNAFVLFNAKQTEVGTDGLPKSTSLLYSNTTLRTLYTDITNQANAIIQGVLDGNPSSLADLGITFVDYPGDDENPATTGLMQVDTEALKDALTTNFDGVRDVFGYHLTSSSADLILYKSGGLHTINEFTLDIDRGNNSYILTYLDENGASQELELDYTELSTGGVTLKAPAGSVLSGLQMIYGSEDDALGVTVNVTQGIADRFNVISSAALVPNTGLVDVDIASIQTKNTTFDTQISTIEDQIAVVREQLLKKFSALEAAITQANSVLNLLNAQQLANSQ